MVFAVAASAGALRLGRVAVQVSTAARPRAGVALMRNQVPMDANVPRGFYSMNPWQNLAQMRDQRVAGVSHINLAPGKCTLPLPEALALMKAWKEQIGDSAEAFGARARSDSHCVTAGKDGMLGFITRQVLCAEFDEIVFKEEPGRVYGPITTKAGMRLRCAALAPAATRRPSRRRAANGERGHPIAHLRPLSHTLAHSRPLSPTHAGLHLIYLHSCREPISQAEALLGLPFAIGGKKAEGEEAEKAK